MKANCEVHRLRHKARNKAGGDSTRGSADVRLRRESRIDKIIYWTCLIGVVVLGLMKLYGG